MRHLCGAAAILTLALLLRGGFLAVAPGTLATDPDGYRALAVNLVERGTLGRGEAPTAYRPPLYPLLLAPCVALGAWDRAAIGLMHLALGVATVLLTYRLGQRWGLGRLSLPAAALVACDPILLNQSALVMTETLATLLAVVGLLLLTVAAERLSPWRAAAAGAGLALAVLCRPTFLVWTAAAAVLLPWFADTWPRRLKILGAFAAAVAIVLTPWGLRNQFQFGRPIVTTTHGGYTLLLGNNPSFYDYLRTGVWGSVWDADAFNTAWAAQAPRSGPAAELANDRRAYAEARQHIAAAPGVFLYASLVRVGRLWQPLPHAAYSNEGGDRRLARYGVGAWYAVELTLALLGVAWLVLSSPSQPTSGMPSVYLFARGRHPRTWLWGFLLLASFTAVHTVYWTDMRMRAPLVPVVALAAAAGVAGIGAWANRSNFLASK